MAYQAKKAGKPKIKVNPSFVKKVVEIRNHADYGSQKIHFVLKRQGFGISQDSEAGMVTVFPGLM